MYSIDKLLINVGIMTLIEVICCTCKLIFICACVCTQCHRYTMVQLTDIKMHAPVSNGRDVV